MGDTAVTIDERFGEDYGDYARKASRSLQEASAKLDAKSMDEIGEDAREFVRKSPGVALGLAAGAGFLVAWFVLYQMTGSWGYSFHRDIWSGLSRRQYDLINLCGMGLLKLGLFGFFLLPYLGIRLAFWKPHERFVDAE